MHKRQNCESKFWHQQKTHNPFFVLSVNTSFAGERTNFVLINYCLFNIYYQYDSYSSYNNFVKFNSYIICIRQQQLNTSFESDNKYDRWKKFHRLSVVIVSSEKSIVVIIISNPQRKTVSLVSRHRALFALLNTSTKVISNVNLFV